jgi:hypothetical protein
MRPLRDPEVRILAAISQALEVEYASDERDWEGSPFAWIRPQPSRKKGAIGETLVAGWLATRDFNVARSPDSDADRTIEDKRAEIKFSTLWANGGCKFQQLRDQDYEIVICLGVSPFDAHCWVIPRADVLRLWRDERVISPQHGGSAGSDTAWIAVQVASPPSWLSAYGGSLADGIRVLSRLTGFDPPGPGDELTDRGKPSG